MASIILQEEIVCKIIVFRLVSWSMRTGMGLRDQWNINICKKWNWLSENCSCQNAGNLESLPAKITKDVHVLMKWEPAAYGTREREVTCGHTESGKHVAQNCRPSFSPTICGITFGYQSGCKYTDEFSVPHKHDLSHGDHQHTINLIQIVPTMEPNWIPQRYNSVAIQHILSFTRMSSDRFEYAHHKQTYIHTQTHKSSIETQTDGKPSPPLAPLLVWSFSTGFTQTDSYWFASSHASSGARRGTSVR